VYLYSYPSTHGMSRLAAGSAWEQFEVCLRMTTEWTYRCTPRSWSSEFGDGVGGRNRASLKINLQAVIERVWIYTWRPWLSEFGDTLGGRDQARLDGYLEAVDGRRAGCWDSMHQLVNSQPWECDKVSLLMSSHGELADEGRSCREARQKHKLHSGVNS